MTPPMSAPPRPIRVVLVDDHPLVREGVRAVLATGTEIEVVAEAGSAAEALALVESARPDVMVVDVGMKELNGIELTRELSGRFPAVRVLILSMYESVKYVLSATRAGAPDARASRPGWYRSPLNLGAVRHCRERAIASAQCATRWSSPAARSAYPLGIDRRGRGGNA